MDLTHLRQFRAPAALATVVFVLGFGAMLILWLAPHSPATPGWPHYRAATFGDGALVPALAACLFAASRWLRARTGRRSPRLALLTTAAVAATGGVLLQLSWLLDDHPQTNWSLPRPHHFAVSGWYHAAFLVAAVTLVATMAVDVLVQLSYARQVRTRELRRALARGELLFLALASGWAFCLLVTIDGGRGSSAVTTIGSVLVLVALSLLALAWAVRELLAPASASIVAAAATAIGVAVLCEWWPAQAGARLVQPIVLIATLALADGARQAHRRWLLRAPKAVALVAVAGATCLLPMGHHINLGAALALSALPLVLSSVLERLGMARAERNLIVERAAPWILCLIIPITDYISRGQKSAFLTAGLTFLVASIVVSRLTFPFLKREWVEFNRVETDERPGHQLYRSQIAKHVVYRMVCLGASILVAFTQIAFAVGPSLGFVQGTGAPSIPPGVYLAATVIVVLSVVSWRLPSRTSTPDAVALGMLVLAVALATVVIAAAMAGERHNRAVIVTAVQALLVFAWQVESVIGNALMRGIGTRRSLVFTSLASAALIASLDYWAATAGQLTSSHTPANAAWCLLVIAAVIIATVLWSYVCGKLLDPFKAKGVHLDSQIADYRLTSSQLQDAAIMGLLTAGLVWMVGLTFSHIPPEADERVSAILTFLIGLFLFFTSMFKWTLENNVKNADRFYGKAFPGRKPRRAGRLFPIPGRRLPTVYRAAWRTHQPGRTSAKRFSFILDAHIAAQNLNASVMLVATIAGAVGIANEIEAES